MRRTIILFIDVFSDDPVLIDFGVTAAKGLNATLELFDVQLTARSLPMKSSVHLQANKAKEQSVVFRQAENKMKAIRNLVQKEWPDTDFKLIKDVMYGKIPGKENYLLDEIAALQPAAIVMRIKHGFTLWNELFGVMETRLAGKTNCPLLLLPETILNFHLFRNLGYILDRNKSIEEAVKDLRFLIRIAQSEEITLNIYYLTDAKGTATEFEISVMRTHFLNTMDIDSLHILKYNEGDTRKILKELALPSGLDVVAFPYRHKSLWESITSTDLAHRMILKAEVPLVVF